MDSSGKNYNDNKGIVIKTLMLRSDLCASLDEYIILKGTVTVTNPGNANKQTKKKTTTKVLQLKTMHHLSTAFQKSMV